MDDEESNCLSLGNVTMSKDGYCPTTWDNLSCWPAAEAGTIATQPCNDVVLSQPPFPQDLFAFRVCLSNASWLREETNYSMCIDFIEKNYDGSIGAYSSADVITLSMVTGSELHEGDGNADQFAMALAIAYIYVTCSVVSVVMLTATLFIFCYFKTLQCTRISIHKSLVISFIIRCVITIVIFEPFITHNKISYRKLDWLCKFLTSVLLYTLVANTFWMLVEGLFLHNRIAVSVFHTEAPFKIFYFIGWFLPAVVIAIWVGCQEVNNNNQCWAHWYDSHCTWIVAVPIIVSLLLNAVFLVNIIRILIQRLRANNAMEIDQISRKAVKATAVLFPLLGLTNIIFVVSPDDGGQAETAYRIVNAVLQSSQGIFVTVIYCFMNAEVQLAIRKKWMRYQALRTGRGGHIRHSYRTSSMRFSASETNGTTNRGSLFNKNKLNSKEYNQKIFTSTML